MSAAIRNIAGNYADLAGMPTIFSGSHIDTAVALFSQYSAASTAGVGIGSDIFGPQGSAIPLGLG